MLHATLCHWVARERELRCIFYTHCTNNTAQVAAMRLLAGFEATSGTDSDDNGDSDDNSDADVNTDTDPARHSRRTFWRSTFQIRDRNATSANTSDGDGDGDGDHWRWPSNVSTASAVMLMSRQQRLRRSSTTSVPTSSITAITSRGTVAADTYKTSQADGGDVHPWREQTTN